MTREQIGRVLGILIVTVGILALTYLAAAFCVWNLDASEWSVIARSCVVLFSASGISIWIDYLRAPAPVEKSDTDEE
jgi:hypothetical protein